MVTNAGEVIAAGKILQLPAGVKTAPAITGEHFVIYVTLIIMHSGQLHFSQHYKQGDNYEAVFSQGRAEFRRRDFSLETHTEIVVSPEDDIELRRVHITNRSRKKRYIEITSYAEVVLASPMADETHPAFSNLFVQTEINEQRHAIICTRRPRSVDEHNPWMFHLMKVHDAEITEYFLRNRQG